MSIYDTYHQLVLGHLWCPSAHCGLTMLSLALLVPVCIASNLQLGRVISLLINSPSHLSSLVYLDACTESILDLSIDQLYATPGLEGSIISDTMELRPVNPPDLRKRQSVSAPVKRSRTMAFFRSSRTDDRILEPPRLRQQTGLSSSTVGAGMCWDSPPVGEEHLWPHRHVQQRLSRASIPTSSIRLQQTIEAPEVARPLRLQEVRSVLAMEGARQLRPPSSPEEYTIVDLSVPSPLVLPRNTMSVRQFAQSRTTPKMVSPLTPATDVQLQLDRRRGVAPLTPAQNKPIPPRLMSPFEDLDDLGGVVAYPTFVYGRRSSAMLLDLQRSEGNTRQQDDWLETTRARGGFI